MGLPQDSRTVTASASVPGDTLARFDVEVLKKIRDMAERHVKDAVTRADGVLIAGADPGAFIVPEFMDEFMTVASASWDEGIGAVYGLLGDLAAPASSVVITRGIQDAANLYEDMLKALISRGSTALRNPILGEFRSGSLVQYGDVRPILSQLGGGSADVSVPLSGGITSGNTMREWLRSNGIDTDKKIWLYGYEDQPRRTFNGHLQMDGLVFENWDDEGLLIAPQDAWLRRSHYQPGDHWGCGCVVAPYVPNLGEPYILDTPTV